jgi:hypothetical protein
VTEPEVGELYVGWRERMPVLLARFVRARLGCAAIVLFAIAAGLVAAQRPFAHSVHEFGTVRELEGWIAERPYPMLRVARPGIQASERAVSSYLLVSPWKFGAAERIRGLDGARVRLRGTLIYRGGSTMVELSADPLVRIDGADPAPAPRIEELGEKELAGEIVDSKCFLGVMKPGEFKVHRACAARCLSGGVPPLFLVRGESGWAPLLLTSSSGGPAERVALIQYVAEPLRIRGRVTRIDDWLILAADPASYERLE